MMLAAMGAMAAGVLTMTWGALRPTRADALTNCDTSTAGLNAAEQQVVSEINAFRAENGLPPLKVSPNLSRAAAWMVEDMAAKGYFSHTDSLGRSAFTRVRQCGYVGSGAGENLAVGFGASTVVAAWKGSTMGHREAMLSPMWKVIGVGNAGGYWAADFGTDDDSGDTSVPGDTGGGSGSSGPTTPTPFPPTSTPVPRIPTAAPTGAVPTATPTQFVPTPANSYAYPSFLPIRRVSIPMLAFE